MFLQHGGIVCWGKTARAMRETLIPISKRAVAVGLERASTFPLVPSETTHLALTLPAGLVRCICIIPKLGAPSTESSWCLPKAPLGLPCLCHPHHRLDVLLSGSHCVQKALRCPEPSDISENMTSLWHLLPHSNECSNF